MKLWIKDGNIKCNVSKIRRKKMQMYKTTERQGLILEASYKTKIS